MRREQFYTAMVDEHETTFGVEHWREDVSWASAVLRHRENDQALLELMIRNPRVGLLNEERNQWLWWAWDDGEIVHPLFFGRLVAIPDGLQGGAIHVIFRARPSDWLEQKRALAETLKVAPFWDEIWWRPEERDDPDVVLEGYTKLWHWDRTGGPLSVSDIAAGEDGEIDLTRIAHDSLDLRPATTPLTAMRVEARAFWDQRAEGLVDLSEALTARFQELDSGDGWVIETLTIEGLMRDWPEEGRRIGSGWSVGPSEVERADGVSHDPEAAQTVLTTADVASFPVGKLRPTFQVRFDAARSYAETMQFTVRADVQAVESEPGAEAEGFLRASAPVDEPLAEDTDETPAIVDVRRRQYFPTDRGRRSVEYLIARARATMVKGARAMEAEAVAPWDPALLGINCRMNCRFPDPRISGGEAVGKVIGYVFAVEGGQRTIAVTIGCMVGQGATVEAVDGDPVYVEDGVLEDGIQLRTGQFHMPVAGEILYPEFGHVQPADDGVDFINGMTPDDVVEDIVVAGTVPEQREVVEDEGWGSIGEAAAALNEVHTRICVRLVPLIAGPFETHYDLGELDLMVPKTIDLEAGSAP